MNPCKTCKWWLVPPVNEYWGSDEILEPKAHPDVPLPVTFEVRYCRNPDIGFCERPTASNRAAVQDGSYYMANLVTAEGFGCVLHESGELTQEDRKRLAEPLSTL